MLFVFFLTPKVRVRIALLMPSLLEIKEEKEEIKTIATGSIPRHVSGKSGHIHIHTGKRMWPYEGQITSKRSLSVWISMSAFKLVLLELST